MVYPVMKVDASEARYDRDRNLVRARRSDGGVNPFAAARRGRRLPTDYP
jgi:hypothetical protein